MRLLLVEDVATLPTTARRLRHHGHRVTTVGSRLEASALVGRFDCGIFELHLSDGNGIELAKRLRARGIVDRIVFFTDDLDDATHARASEIAPVVPRSAGVAELARVVASGRPRVQSGTELCAAPRRVAGDE